VAGVSKLHGVTNPNTALAGDMQLSPGEIYLGSCGLYLVQWGKDKIIELTNANNMI
jgi:hypothetical protein